MSDEENGEKPEVLRVRMRKGADSEEREQAVKDALYENMKESLLQRASENGVKIQNPESMSVEELNNYSQMLTKLEREKEIRSLKSTAEDSENITWDENQEGISRSHHVHVSEDKSYSSIESMIRDLRAQARDKSDVVKSAEAEAIISELWKKYAKALQDNIRDPTKRSLPLASYEEDKETAKRNKIKKYQREGA